MNIRGEISNFAVMISISKERINELPVEEYEGNTIVINYPRDVDKAINYLLTQSVVGFDTETRPSFKKGRMHKVCLLQIATHDECFLFRINKTGLTESIRRFFERYIDTFIPTEKELEVMRAVGGINFIVGGKPSIYERMSA